MAKLKFIAPLFMAGAAATAIAAAPVAAADAFAGTSITQFAQSPGGDGCLYGVCGSGDASGGGGCVEGVGCGSGNIWDGGGGCVEGVGCFNWGV